MRSLKDKIDELNNDVMPHFEKSKVYGLCIVVGRGGERKIKALDYDVTEVKPDDSYDFFAYHRIADEQVFVNPQEKGAGRKYTMVSPMLLTVHTKHPYTLDKLIKLLQIRSDVQLVNVNPDSYGIAGAEWTEDTQNRYNYDDYFLFQLRYNLSQSTEDCRL